MARRHTNTWKSVELRIAAILGGKRRGADTRSDNAGKSDIIKPGWSVEVKHSKKPSFGLMLEAIDQAERNRPKPDDIPIAVIHKERQEYADSLVVMRLSTFSELFANPSIEVDDAYLERKPEEEQLGAVGSSLS